MTVHYAYGVDAVLESEALILGLRDKELYVDACLCGETS